MIASDPSTAMAGATRASAIQRFDFPAMSRVWHGAGCHRQLAREVASLRADRVLVVTSPSFSTQTPWVDRVVRLLGPATAAVFTEAVAHVPDATVSAAAEEARRARANIVVSIGGGSVIDCAKAVALASSVEGEAADSLQRLAIRGDTSKGFDVPSSGSTALPHIALPTTLSAAEFGPTFTVTNEHTRAKEMYYGQDLTPRVVFLDAALAASTPTDIWATSGVRAVDHCVEGYLSCAHMPFTDALAFRALGDLITFLPRCMSDPSSLDARMRCQLAAWMSAFGSHNILGGLSHAIGHQLGAHARIAHGHTSCIVLPRVLEFNLPAVSTRLAELATVFGHTHGSDDQLATAFVDDLKRFVRSLGMPTTLTEAGVTDFDAEAIARATMGEVALINNPRPVAEADVRAILESAR